ncbi:DEAD/DEAH box helicase [Actinomyces radicidentis]|uniref:DEAD/DEAH box helicase n=1 Tax=Actinomyces radicidentis TaxID=111015 RepID=UPI000A503869|nr:DEAD/DEAH box helicase [Actinomyces radicidentis]
MPNRTHTAPRAPFASSNVPAGGEATFASLGVDADLVADLDSRGFTRPFPIQTATLPDTLSGRDVLGRGRTGSGKTLAFALPLVQRLAAEDMADPGRPIGLVLAPTRELAIQIADTIKPLADAAELTVTTIFGGVSQKPQEKAMAKGVDIVVACPGRLLDLMGQGIVHLDDVSITVLDEADHMADLGFLPNVRRIMRATPAKGQRMLFSATLDNGVDKIVDEFLRDPLHHSVDPASSPVRDMDHRVWLLADKTAKDGVVLRLASGTGQRILFTRTKHLARRLARKLVQHGIPAVELQGNMSQNARERAMHAFSSGEAHVMVATDIAARGIDVSGVELVVHVDPPAEHKAYLHRSGRTARAGAAGTVVTLVLPEQKHDVQVLLKKARIKADIERIRPDDAAVAELVGEIAPVVAAEDMPEGVAVKGGTAATRGGSGSGSKGGSGRSGRGRSGRSGRGRSGGGGRGGHGGRDGRSGSGRSGAAR